MFAFPCGPPSASRQNRPTNQRRNLAPRKKMCRTELFIKNNPIWGTSLKIIYLPFSYIHFPPGKLYNCISVFVNSCFLHGYKLGDPIYLYWEVKTEAITDPRHTKIMVRYWYGLGQIFVKNINWSSPKWVELYISFPQLLILKKEKKSHKGREKPQAR